MPSKSPVPLPFQQCPIDLPSVANSPADLSNAQPQSNLSSCHFSHRTSLPCWPQQRGFLPGSQKSASLQHQSTASRPANTSRHFARGLCHPLCLERWRLCPRFVADMNITLTGGLIALGNLQGNERTAFYSLELKILLKRGRLCLLVCWGGAGRGGAGEPSCRLPCRD